MHCVVLDVHQQAFLMNFASQIKINKTAFFAFGKQHIPFSLPINNPCAVHKCHSLTCIHLEHKHREHALALSCGDPKARPTVCTRPTGLTPRPRVVRDDMVQKTRVDYPSKLCWLGCRTFKGRLASKIVKKSSGNRSAKAELCVMESR